jgi:hypothetical protein
MSINRISGGINVIDLAQSATNQSINIDIKGKIEQDSAKLTNNSNEKLDNKLEYRVNPTEDELVKKFTENNIKHGVEPLQNATQSFNSLETELNKINEEVFQYNPSIKDIDWDFTYKNGKLEVSGDTLSKEDKTFIKEKLSSSQIINDSIQKYNKAVVDHYQPSKSDNYNGAGSKLGAIPTKFYFNIQDQIDKGILSYKKLMKETIESNGNSEVVNKYYSALQMAENSLTASVDTYA